MAIVLSPAPEEQRLVTCLDKHAGLSVLAGTFSFRCASLRPVSLTGRGVCTPTRDGTLAAGRLSSLPVAFVPSC